jgi:hypothetical protein
LIVTIWNIGTVVFPPFCVSYEYDPRDTTLHCDDIFRDEISQLGLITGEERVHPV